MSTNLSKQKRDDLLSKISAIRVYIVQIKRKRFETYIDQLEAI